MRNLLGLAWYNWLCSQRRAMMQFIIYLQPVFNTILYALANPYTKDEPVKAFWFVVINGSLLNIWGINVFATISDIHRDRWTGMLTAVRLSTTPLMVIFVVRAITNTLHGLTSLLMFAVMAYVLYRPDINSVFLTLAWPILISSFFLIALFSLLFAAVVAMSPQAHHIMNFIEYPVFIVAGIGFTIGLLPIFMQWFALLMPFGYFAELARTWVGISLIDSVQLQSYFWLPIIGLFIIALIGTFQLKIMEKKLSETGNIL